MLSVELTEHICCIIIIIVLASTIVKLTDVTSPIVRLLIFFLK